MSQKFVRIPSDEPGFWRPRALRDIRGCNGDYLVCEGDEGGYVSYKAMLSQHGAAWLGPEARLMDHAKLSGNAYVGGHAVIGGQAWVYGDAVIDGVALVTGHASVLGRARVRSASIGGRAVIDGGRFTTHMVITSPDDFLTIDPTPWGTLTVARTADGHLITCGCQIFRLSDWDELLYRHICACHMGTCDFLVAFRERWSPALQALITALVDRWEATPLSLPVDLDLLDDGDTPDVYEVDDDDDDDDDLLDYFIRMGEVIQL